MKLLFLVALLAAVAPALATAPTPAPTLALSFDWLDPDEQPPPIPLDGLRAITFEQVYAYQAGWYTRAIFHGDLDTVAFLNQHIDARVTLNPQN